MKARQAYVCGGRLKMRVAVGSRMKQSASARQSPRRGFCMGGGSKVGATC